MRCWASNAVASLVATAAMTICAAATADTLHAVRPGKAEADGVFKAIVPAGPGTVIGDFSSAFDGGLAHSTVNGSATPTKVASIGDVASNFGLAYAPAVSPIPAVPEPSPAILLLASAGLWVAWFRARMRSNAL